MENTVLNVSSIIRARFYHDVVYLSSFPTTEFVAMKLAFAANTARLAEVSGLG